MAVKVVHDQELSVQDWLGLPVYRDESEMLPVGLRVEGGNFFRFAGSKFQLVSVDGVLHRQEFI